MQGMLKMKIPDFVGLPAGLSFPPTCLVHLPWRRGEYTCQRESCSWFLDCFNYELCVILERKLFIFDIFFGPFAFFLFLYYFECAVHFVNLFVFNCTGSSVLHVGFGFDGRGYSLVAAHRLLVEVASLLAKLELQGTQSSAVAAGGLSSCLFQGQLPRGLWDSSFWMRG